jgi:hypothetical protein
MDKRKWSVRHGIGMGLLAFPQLSEASFYFELNTLPWLPERDFTRKLEYEGTDIDRTLRHFWELESIFGKHLLFENPHARIIELNANRAWLTSLINLISKERANKLQEEHTRLCRQYEERKQLAADLQKRKIVYAQRQQHMDWLRSLFKLSNEEMATKRNEIQMQLYEAQNNENHNLIILLQLQLNELNKLIQIKSFMSKEAFEVLCQWKQMTEALPLEKLKEELQRNLNIIQNMLKLNKENPEKLKRRILETVRDIETTLYYLITHSQFSAPIFPCFSQLHLALFDLGA